MLLDTFNLECFIMVVEEKSFTRAAEKLGRTQSAVSQQVTKLEGYLGCQLIHRGRQLDLTPQGEIFFFEAKKIFQMHRNVLDRFKDPDLEGEVRIGLPEDVADVFLSDVLADFIRSHPRILLNIDCDLTLNLFDHFKNNQYDLVVVKMNFDRSFPSGQEVWSEQMVWVGQDHLLQPDQPIPLVLAPEPCVYRSNAIKTLDENNTPWRIALSTHSHTGKMAAVGAGVGMTVLPKNMVPHHTSWINQSALLPPLEDIQVSLLKKSDDNAAVNSLEEFIVSKLRSN